MMGRSCLRPARGSGNSTRGQRRRNRISQARNFPRAGLKLSCKARMAQPGSARDRRLGPDGTTWIGPRSQGVFGYNGGRKTLRHYSTKNGLSDDNITCLLLDRFGVLWFGTWSGGLYSLDRATSKLTRFSGESPGKGGKQEERASTGTLSPKRGESSGRLLSERVTALCEYDNGELWIGTGTGLDVLDSTRENIRRIEIPSPIPHTVASMARDRLGRMWIGVTELGLFSYSHGRLIQFATSNDFGHTLNFVRALYPDTAASTESNLLLWVGTRRTVNKVG